jgi:hypothetical protein
MFLLQNILIYHGKDSATGIDGTIGRRIFVGPASAPRSSLADWPLDDDGSWGMLRDRICLGLNGRFPESHFVYCLVVVLSTAVSHICIWMLNKTVLLLLGIQRLPLSPE